MTTSWRTPAALAASAVLACTAAGCSQSSGSSTTAGGGTTARAAAQHRPVTLTVGTDDFATYQGAMQLQHFAQEVAKDSKGSIAIKPEYHAGGTRPHWDQYIAGMVKDGRLDMGMVRSQSWDEMGVTSLQALTAPFLITSDSLTATVLSDPTITTQLLSGLPKAGYTGLALFPDGLRHPFGFHGALKGVADYRGKVLRTPYSQTSDDTMTALGAASVTDADPDATTQAGADSEYQLAPNAVATGNVTFYPKVNVLFISDAAKRKLTKAQLAVLGRAARRSAQWSSIEQPSDADAATTFCQQYGTIAAASPAQLAGLVTATRSVVEGLRRDATTARLIDEITALKAKDHPVAPVTACPKGSVPSPQPATPIDGTYAFTVTAAAFKAAGGTDENTIDENAGTYVQSFSHSVWKQTQEYTQGEKKGTSVSGQGEYTYRDGRLKILFDHQPGDWASMDAVKQPDGSLTFSHIVEGTKEPQLLDLDHAEFVRWTPSSAG